ncbi:MAG: ABC transporter ATP-binding protein [Candidatus Kerfeldbacteria bacterium CG_4_10_14_0_8_um_filter_42_10]|uniref:ABC transporter ATP-binding protein n=1 Tax=Candidatus Kerfeldbacteria bacterium CG_4_10_14_0_8_um_filter_42_10 TaxID=2014248 RepID=A0A2M7RJQ4_9BACT|nr:MAG: ABC transporter ATP-binding protein [Candidatus Kerfeldbacteria bacterium CG_4_10_14_0_8_um_filter_42_10]
MIKVDKISKIYGQGPASFKALDKVSFKLEKGANLAILGKSGSGKSTLMHALAGLDRPTSGSIAINGKDLWSRQQKEIDAYRNQMAGFVFQDFYLQNEETVLENIMVPLEIRGVADRKPKAYAALERLEIKDKARNLTRHLSGGEKQRVCVARAIIGQPEILFADEPTGNLDSKTSEKVEEILFKLNKELGTTLVVVTHNEDLARRFANSIILKDGRIIAHEGKELAA